MFGFKGKSENKAVALGYNATADKGRRQAPKTKVTSESVALGKKNRSKLQATAQEQQRNHSLMAWMIRQHLDYVSSFKIQFKYENDSTLPLVDALEKLFSWHARPENFDIARRLGREEAFRGFESEKVVSGDAAMVKLGKPYYKMQMIESDLIAFPNVGKKQKTKDTLNSNAFAPIPQNITDNVNKDSGVILNNSGAKEQFCICNRGYDGKKLSFDHLEKWNNVIFDGYYTRFSSQTRGVSPLSSAINSMQDLYEGFEWALLQHKVQSLFGIALMRDYNGTDSQTDITMDGLEGSSQSTDTTATDTTPDEAAKTISTTVSNLTPRETFIIDMDQNGKVETIEAKTPSGEYISACNLTIRLCMIALDIPMTFFDSNMSSFAGMLADRNLYEKSCQPKIDKNKWKRQEYSDFVVDSYWFSPRFKIAEVAASVGITDINVVKDMVEWISAGFPWLQKHQEIAGDIKAINNGLDNPIDAARRRGGDAMANLQKTSRFLQKAKKLDVPIAYGESGQRTAEEIEEAVASAMIQTENDKAVE
jgi:capsid protein